jgi:MraZ protein
MLRGNQPARVDEKGRLKVPAPFKEELEQNYGRQFYITSLDGRSVWIYPLDEWNRIEEKLQSAPTFNKSRRKFLYRTNYYGQLVEMDNQGRVLIPSILRETAAMRGDVAVLGQLTLLEVWNNERFKKEQIEENPLNDEDQSFLDHMGI